VAARLLLPVALLAVAAGAFLITSTDWSGALLFRSFALGGIGLVARLPRQPDAVSAELASTAHAALRPASVSVWVREREEGG
jgi:hypothetical protein